eukprot:g15263.t1
MSLLDESFKIEEPRNYRFEDFPPPWQGTVNNQSHLQNLGPAMEDLYGPVLSLVHLLQLLNPGGLSSDEPVRNYMRSVQQAPDIAINFVGFLNTVRHVMASAEEEVDDAKGDRGEKKKTASYTS